MQSDGWGTFLASDAQKLLVNSAQSRGTCFSRKQAPNCLVSTLTYLQRSLSCYVLEPQSPPRQLHHQGRRVARCAAEVLGCIDTQGC